MPYMKRIVKAGNIIEVDKYYATNYGKKNEPRGVRKNITPEKQMRVNEKRAERSLKWLMHENFKRHDIHLVLTYRPELRPDANTAKKIIKNTLKRFRRLYKKYGLEFKYILVTEFKNKAIHHHLIVNHIDAALLQSKWRYGMARATYLYDDYEKLAAYFIKETRKTFRDKNCPFKKRWSSSNNLRKPKIKKQVIKSSKWNEIPKPIKGYYIDVDSIYNGEHRFTGHPYQTYVMKKIE